MPPQRPDGRLNGPHVVWIKGGEGVHIRDDFPYDLQIGTRHRSIHQNGFKLQRCNPLSHPDKGKSRAVVYRSRGEFLAAGAD